MSDKIYKYGTGICPSCLKRKPLTNKSKIQDHVGCPGNQKPKK